MCTHTDTHTYRYTHVHMYKNVKVTLHRIVSRSIYLLFTPYDRLYAAFCCHTRCIHDVTQLIFTQLIFIYTTHRGVWYK